VQLLLGIVRLLFVLVRLFGFRLGSQRVPSGEAKSSVLAAIEQAKKRVPLAVALRVIGLSASRYHAWLRLDQSCTLDDRSSCPRTIPTQLTSHEISAIQKMVTAEEYRHIPLGSLALLAQRLENVNGEVDALAEEGVIHRVLAQLEVAYSNSMIEAYWRSLRVNWLHLNELDAVTAVRRLVGFHVEQHNQVVPHSAFHGETPDEMYFDTGTAVAATLAEQRARARQDRLASNRALTCGACRSPTTAVGPSDHLPPAEREPR